LRERSGGAFDLPEGTVYPALHRLEKQRLVRSRWAVTSGRRRRVYELSGAGADALVERTTEWRNFAAAVRAVLA
jgi:DNA-binding PadR family transcriptional regulator